MPEYVLETHGLSKKYKDKLVINNIDMSIRKGSIYGFIGQNGAGKSTLIRLITGLAFPTDGEFQLFGSTDKKEFVDAKSRIGVMIEAPALYLNMTARENLEVHRLLKGVPGKKSIETTLELVDLADVGKKKVKNFSLGMKQRLGIAIALLGDPEFLILDEPINGLDPMGVVAVRKLLKNLNDNYDITILISSHILSELHLLATDYGIIHQGKLVEQLTAEALDEKSQKHIHIKVDDVSKASTVFQNILGTDNFEVKADHSIRLLDFVDEPTKVSKALTQNNLLIEEFMPMGEDLESYFSHLIGGVTDE